MPTAQDVRDTLKRVIPEQGETYSGLARLLGRNRSYLQQFVERGTPSKLEDKDRAVLARYLGIEEEQLGGPPSGKPRATASVPRLAVQASAGTGALVDGEFVIGSRRFDQRWLRQISRAKPTDLSLITISGDSMSPTLIDGDEVLVDASGAHGRLRDGIYVLRRDDTLMVKRLALSPAPGRVDIVSDNPAYPTWRDTALSDVGVLGRVIWFSRTLG